LSTMRVSYSSHARPRWLRYSELPIASESAVPEYAMARLLGLARWCVLDFKDFPSLELR